MITLNTNALSPVQLASLIAELEARGHSVATTDEPLCAQVLSAPWKYSAHDWETRPEADDLSSAMHRAGIRYERTEGGEY